MFRFDWIKKFVTFLYNVVRNIIPIWDGPEQHRMEEEVMKNEVQSDGAAMNRGNGEDTVDVGLASDLKDSLEEVSKVIYTKFVSIWHTPPEKLQNQPLYKEINSGIQNIFFNIKHKARPLEEYEIIISIASRFIAHFKNKRQKKVPYSFKTRQEEVDFIRKHIKCLLDYWLPESMQRNPIIYVFLTEILSVHVFEPMINSFSDFTSINEAIVEAFNDNPATQQKEDSGKRDKIVQGSTSDESYPIRESDDITSRKVQKKERKGFGKKFKGVFKRKRPKRSETEAEPMFRSCSAAMNSDVGDIVDTGSTDDSEDEENPMTSIIDTSLQMWIKKNWTATVSEGLAEKEDEYEISVYDESSPDVVLWKTKRRVQDFKFLYTKIYQKYPDFTTSTKPKTTGRPTDADGQFFHSIGISPDEFIKILVDFLKKYKEREAVFFFSPFHYKDDENQYLKFLPNTVGEHLSEQSNTDDELPGDFSSSEMESDYSGAEFRTLNTQNEEEKCNRVTENKSSPTDLQDTDHAGSDRSKCKGDELLLDSCDKESDSKEVYQADGFRSLRSREKKKKYQSASHSEREDMSSTDVTGKEEFPSENADRANFFNIQRPIIMDSRIQKSSQNVVGFTSQGPSQTVEQRKKKLQKTLLDVLYQLTDEVLGGGNSVVLFLHKIGFLKTFNKTILDFIPNIYAEEQVIWYLKQVAELLMSPVPPQQLPPDVLQSKALDILKNKVRGLMPRVLKFLENWIMKNLKASHQALQDPLANKETIYGMLEDLTKIITDEGGIFNPMTVH